MARSSIIAIGASAGGEAALRSLAATLPRTLSAPVLVVLHIGTFRTELPALLNAAGPVPAKHAEDGETIFRGQIYVAPPDHHMTVAGGRLRLLRGPKENCARPAIDPLLRSVAESYGRLETIEQRRWRPLHTVGNLTLLTGPLNTSVKKGPFKAKSREIEKLSGVDQLMVSLDTDCPDFAEIMVSVSRAYN